MKRFKNWLVNLDGFSGYSMWGVVHHPLEAFFCVPFRNVRAFIQRGRRGWADRDAWSLDYYLSSWMPEALREIKENKTGIPVTMLPEGVFEPTKEQLDEAFKKWEGIIEEMAVGFEASRIKDAESIFPNNPRWAELDAKQKKGLALFAEHFESLWD